ncbi:acyl-CoA dehydrogenase [Kitasatospora gansuensis]
MLSDAGELGETYAARLVADDVARAAADLGVRHPESSAAVSALAGLYGAVSARRLAGSLLTAGTLRSAEIRQLPAIVDRLCDRLLPHLGSLEEEFGYPQAVVGAPLGEPDFNSALAGSLGWHRGGPS